jgi:hypothetical protein
MTECKQEVFEFQVHKGKALAAHSTLNRLELGALGGDARYKKIIAKPQRSEPC